MVRHSEQYQELVRGGLTPGRCLSVEAAEHLSGLPQHWTSPKTGLVNVEDVKKLFPDGEAAVTRIFPVSLTWFYILYNHWI